MKFSQVFSQLTKQDVTKAGGKGASLGEMTQAGIPVPPGFVILSEAFEQFLEETDLGVEIDTTLHTVDTQAMHTVEHASERIQKMILEAKMPDDIKGDIQKHFETLGAEYVAVRSSATAEDSANAAWAGQLDSFLNTTKVTLLENVQRCWASLFTPRAIFYRFEQGLHASKISVAVVVQKMVESEVSGIAFSVHPVTEDRNQLIIEAGYGLGEAIVSGQITPDSYVVEKSPRRIIDKNIVKQERGIYRAVQTANEWREIEIQKQEQSKLSDEQILELSEIIITIENHYDFPCDIEWAYADGKFFIVQSRPITTLNMSEGVDAVNGVVRILEKNQSITLTTVFSREKSLYYFEVWNQCDREGAEMFFGHRYEPVLFVIPPKGKKGSVWYEPKNMEQVSGAALEILSGTDGEELFEKMRSEIDRAWAALEVYAKGKEIESVDELKSYQRELLRYWQTMNSALWAIIDDPRLPEHMRAYFVRVREKTERYSERWSLLPTEFFATHFPRYRELVFVITFDEMVRLSEGAVSDAELEALGSRMRGCFLVGEQTYTLDTLDTFLAEHHLQFERVADENFREFSGTTAFPGRVRGAVKIVDGTQDIEKIKEGDVLVTQMTNPKYVSAIKLAAAVVTDEGGALCHAAIVARELRKPCIIGTKIATQVLHDGDLVEVDADNGVVRIVKRAVNGDMSSQSLRLEKKYNIPHLRISEFHFSHPKGVQDSTFEQDFQFLFEKKLKRMFIRRRTILFIESCRYAAEATWKRWGIPFAFMDYGETMVKNVFQTENLNEEAGALWWEKIQNDENFVPSLLHEFSGIIDIDLALAKHPILQKESWSDEELIELLNVYMSWLSQFFEIVYPWFAIDTMKERYLEPFLKEQYPEKHEDILSRLLRPTELPFSSLEQESLVQVAELNDKTFEKALETHTREYRSIALRDIDDQPHDIKYFRSRVKNMREEGIEKAKENITHLKEEINGADDLESSLDAPREIKDLIHLIRSFAFLRTHSIDHMNIVLLAFQPVFQAIADKAQLDLEELMYLTLDEMVSGIGGTLRDAKVIARDRMTMPYLYLIAPQGSYLSVGDESVACYEKIKEASDITSKEVTSLQGVVAFPGKVTGRVRLILDRKKSDELLDGEVLVTPMTIPDFVPAMKRSVAIVTNEGGVLCHAAIMSRELRKPCVIATKNATDVLHNGDLVEVDADDGVVKILERAEENGIDFEKRKWVVYGASGWPVYITPFGVVSSRKFPETYGLSTEGIGMWNGSNFDWLFDEAELNKFAVKLLPKLLRQPWKLYNNWQLQAEKFDHFHGKMMDADLSKCSDDALQEWAKKYYEAFMAQYVANNFIEPLSFYFQHHLRDLLAREGVEEDKIGRLRDAYGTSSKLNYIKQCIEEYKKVQKKDEIVALLKKFHYLKNDYTGSHQITKHDLEELEAQGSPSTEPIVLDETLPKRARDLLAVLQMTATLQDVRKAQSLMWISGAEKIVREVSGRVAIPVEELLFATWEEIIAKNFDRGELQRRKEGCVIFWQSDKTDVYSGTQAIQMRVDFKKSLIGEKLEKKEVPGVSASGGRVTGRVVVVSDVSQFGKVKEGDILVSMMTRPEYLPVMRLASAIVTDEGGITSHAAIVAREMKKPCVIGTKIATQILKDGDLVEVDADNGVVRILK